MGENGELLRRVNESLSGTIHEQLRALVQDVREAMQSLSDASSGVAVSQRQVDETVAELTRRADAIGADTNDSLEIVRADVESFAGRSQQHTTDSMNELRVEVGRKIDDLATALAGIAKRLESMEHSVELVRFQRGDRASLNL